MLTGDSWKLVYSTTWHRGEIAICHYGAIKRRIVIPVKESV